MPELPEVETTKNGIAPHIKHQSIKTVKVRERKLRWPISEEIGDVLVGRKVTDISRRGKYILLTVGPTEYVMIHLGMSGSLRILTHADAATAGKHDHVDIAFANEKILRYTDPRKFGSWLWVQGNADAHKLLASLGPEPLTDAFNSHYLIEQAKGKKSPIKTLIMDSHCVVGVGNIYATEALFMTGIHPKRAAGQISAKRLHALTEAIKQILAHAIEVGGTTLRDFTQSDGKPGYFKQSLKVYGREGEPCVVCERPLKLLKLSGRSTVYCGHCQR